MESKKINQLATELSPDLSDLTIIGDPTTGISKKITLSQMASLFTGTVEEYANLAAFPLVGVADTIYIAQDTNIIYRWSGSAYVELSPNVVSSLVFNDANGFDGTIVLASSVATLTITTALTLGSLPFIGASGALTQDNANLFYDDTNNRLGIATNAPTTPLDVFGSGIIARINGTSTNNGFLGFSNAGTNKWSVGNVQSDHRFRIYSEANSAELVSVLQTGEFGIGIANPLTKFHVDGGATALIANLDANVSVAKSLSFRSDNSNRINLEVSGTESGSNAGADLFLRTFTDAGSLLETPLSIVRSTGVTTIKSLTLTNVLSVANGGTGSATQNFVDLTSTQSIGGAKTLTSALAGTSATFSGLITSTNTSTVFYASGATTLSKYIRISNTSGDFFAGVETSTGGNIIVGAAAYSGAIAAANGLNFSGNAGTNNHLSIASTGAATFSSSVTAGATSTLKATGNSFTNGSLILKNSDGTTNTYLTNAGGGFYLSNNGTTANLSILSTGEATFSSGISVGGATATTGGIQFPATQVFIADGNNLDDYEEGTWTPSLNFSTSNGYSTVTASGTYTKIGRLVTVTLILSFDKGTSTGNFTITGLPFTVINSTAGRGGFAVSYLQRIGQVGKIFTAYASENTTTIQPFFTGQLSTATVISVAATDISADTASVVGTITYQV